MNDRKLLGALGEEMAASMLYSEGFRILERNYRSYKGEIDIICDDVDTIYFVEVKTRTGERYGAPMEAVDVKKRAHMKKAALKYMAEHMMDKYASFKVIEIAVNETTDDFMFI